MDNEGILLDLRDLSEVNTWIKQPHALSWQQEIADFLRDFLSAEPAIIAHTSGSTGKPQPITLEKERMRASARMTGSFFGIGPGGTGLLCLPVGFIAGKMMLVRALEWQWKLRIVPPGGRPLESISGFFDFAAMVPLQAQQSLPDLGRVGTLLVGGGTLSQAWAEQLASAPTEVYQSFGMTETISHFALRKLQEGTPAPYATLPGIHIEVDSKDQLIVHAPALHPDPLHTRDVIQRLDATHFHWLGRSDNVINTGGVKVFPEQIEARLAERISVPFFIAGVPDEALGTQVVLIAERAPSLSAEELQEWQNILQTVLGKFERPRTLYCVHPFTRTISEKVVRSTTLEQALNHGTRQPLHY